MQRPILRWFLGSVVGTVCIVVSAFVVSQAGAKRPTPTIDLRSALRVEIADTPEARSRGLGGRDALSDDEGMLFVFEKRGVYPFWMKDTRFPLDIVWINRGIVKEVARLEPPQDPSAVPPWHMPRVFADRVLEVSAGRAEALGIRPGVKLLLP